MQNDDVVKILVRLRDGIDELKIPENNALAFARNDALVEAMRVLEDEIMELSLTPNQMKSKSGLYHN